MSLDSKLFNYIFFFAELIESTDKLFELEEEFEILSVWGKLVTLLSIEHIANIIALT